MNLEDADAVENHRPTEGCLGTNRLRPAVSAIITIVRFIIVYDAALCERRRSSDVVQRCGEVMGS